MAINTEDTANTGIDNAAHVKKKDKEVSARIPTKKGIRACHMQVRERTSQ